MSLQSAMVKSKSNHQCFRCGLQLSMVCICFYFRFGWCAFKSCYLLNHSNFFCWQMSSFAIRSSLYIRCCYFSEKLNEVQKEYRKHIYKNCILREDEKRKQVKIHCYSYASVLYTNIITYRHFYNII